MQKFLMGAVAIVALSAAGASVAGEAQHVVSKADRVSGEAIRASLESMGYRVDRLEAEHDCWEVRAVNDSGLPIKAKYDRATGELIRAKLR